MNEVNPASTRYSAAVDDKIDRVAEAVKRGAHTGVERAEDAMNQARNVAKSAADNALAAKDKLAAAIEERPLTSVLIAFAIGALLGRMIRR